MSLSYSITHPGRCDALILRGIFLLRKKEIQWFYQEGCSFIYPDTWEQYLSPIPEGEREDLVSAYYKRLTSDDKNIRIEAAKAWSIWEASTSKLIQTQKSLHAFDDEQVAEAFARIECHYFINNGFFETDNWLIENAHKIKDIPTEIVQGRYDVVCPMISAWELHQKLSNTGFHIISNSGHSMTEDGIRSKLIELTDRYAND